MTITDSAEIRAALEHDQEAEDEAREPAAQSQQDPAASMHVADVENGLLVDWRVPRDFTGKLYTSPPPAAQPAEVLEDVRRDATLYRWLRNQHELMSNVDVNIDVISLPVPLTMMVLVRDPQGLNFEAVHPGALDSVIQILMKRCQR